jgi:heme/copper-type cytochrome/quinol oxidase subunit 2
MGKGLDLSCVSRVLSKEEAMRKIEWLIAILLIVIGLGCLTISATTMLEAETLETYLSTFIQLCLWMGIPILVIGIIYVILKKRRSKSTDQINKK